MLPLFALVSSAHAAGLVECGERTYTTDQLKDAAESARSAFAAVDPEGFATSRGIMLDRVRCQTERLDPKVIGQVHLVQALAAQLEGRKDRVAAAIAGMFAADPGYQIPLTVVPEGHPMRGQIDYAARLLREPPTTALPILPSGWIEADGELAKAISPVRAELVQEMDGAGQVIATGYLWPGDPVDAWLAPPAKSEGSGGVSARPASDLSSAARLPPTHPSPWLHRAPLIVAGVGAGVAAAILGVDAFTAKSSFDAYTPSSPASAEDESTLTGLQTRANENATIALVVGGVGLGVATVTVVTW